MLEKRKQHQLDIERILKPKITMAELKPIVEDYNKEYKNAIKTTIFTK